jgi:hypothetical protein
VRRVIVESPYAGNFWQRYLNRRYARACLRDCILRDEAGFASHLLYTQVLNDGKRLERRLGMEAGHEWLFVAHICAVYVDRGISEGMLQGIKAADAAGVHVEYRALDPGHQLPAPPPPLPRDDPELPFQTTDRMPRDVLDPQSRSASARSPRPRM